MKKRRPQLLDGQPDREPAKRRCTMHFELANRQQLLTFSRHRLAQVCRHVLEAEAVPRAKIELALVDDCLIRELHCRYLHLDTPTDVLTFPLSEPGEPLAGQIVVSVETAVRQAARYKTRPEAEVILYFIHGILHLCGYDDHATRDSRRMRRRQGELMAEIDQERT